MSEVENFPKLIGRYEIRAQLGSGAMGSVYLAEDPRIKRKLAIKVVKLQAIGSENERKEFLARFQREAEISGELNDPGIVTIYDVGDSEVGPFLAMEYVPGRPLDALVKSGAAIALKDKLGILAGIATALDHAHAKGVIHRDVKPGNVMITEDFRPKVMDFGIAKREDANLTQTGTFLGTPSYASPEQIREGTASAASDTFSFAVLAFELLSGSLPFPGTSINTILYKIVNEPPVDIKPPVEGLVPDRWQRIFTRALAKSPAARHATCCALVRDLVEAALDLGPSERTQLLGGLRLEASGDSCTSPVPVPEGLPAIQSMAGTLKRPRRGWAWGLAALILAALGGGAYLVAARRAGTQVLLDTVPAGAAVLLDGLEVGRTPMPLALREGQRVTFEKKGFKPMTYAGRSGETSAKVDLEPVLSEEVLRSYPEGASVVLDAVRLEGVTPLVVKGWNQGQKHDLTFTKGDLGVAIRFLEGEVPGSQVYTLLPSGETRAGAEAPAVDANAPGSVRFSGGYGVRVRLDGKDLGEVREGGSVPAPPGAHKLELSNPRVFYKDTVTVTVQPGRAATVSLPALVHLTVNTFPNSGLVLIDGALTQVESDGSTPIAVVRGRHLVNVQGRSGAPWPVDLTGDLKLNQRF